MFGSIKILAKKIQKLDEDKLFKTVMSNKGLQQQIIDENQYQLYELGVYPDGTPTGDYAPSTIAGTGQFKGKIEKGQRYDHITFKDTGDFYDSMRVKVTGEGIVITNQGQKKDTISDQDAHNAMGLTSQSLSELKPLINSLLNEEVRKKIFA